MIMIMLFIWFLEVFLQTWGLTHIAMPKREKGICYIFYRKYTKGHKCDEKKLLYIDCEEEEENEQENRESHLWVQEG